MVEEDWKSDPLTVSVRPGSPLDADEGLNEIAVAGGAVTVNGAGSETPKSVSETVIPIAPWFVRFDAGTVAMSEVALANPVVKALPFQHTVDARVNPTPVT